MKALEKERHRRYETASAFAADIRCYLNREPVKAAPVSALYRLRKFARRHRAGLSVSSIIAACIVVAAGFFMRSMTEQARANEQEMTANAKIGRAHV